MNVRLIFRKNFVCRVALYAIKFYRLRNELVSYISLFPVEFAREDGGVGRVVFRAVLNVGGLFLHKMMNIVELNPRSKAQGIKVD